MNLDGKPIHNLSIHKLGRSGRIDVLFTGSNLITVCLQDQLGAPMIEHRSVAACFVVSPSDQVNHT